MPDDKGEGGEGTWEPGPGETVAEVSRLVAWLGREICAHLRGCPACNDWQRPGPEGGCAELARLDALHTRWFQRGRLLVALEGVRRFIA